MIGKNVSFTGWVFLLVQGLRGAGEFRAHGMRTNRRSEQQRWEEAKDVDLWTFQSWETGG